MEHLARIVEGIMNHSSKLLIGILSVVVVTAMVPPALAAVEEPWSEIEARTKFLRTKHYIEVVRIHSNVFKSAGSKQGEVPGPFPVHVMLPDDYETNLNRSYGVVYLLGGKSGWDNGPELGGATYWSVWCKTPLTMDHLKAGHVTKVDFQDNISEEELGLFNRWLSDEPYDDVIVVSVWNPGGGNTGHYEKYLIGEVVPFIDTHYRTVPNRHFRGIDGACAGAAQAIMISARNPHVFAYAGGQQTDLGSYPETHRVWRDNLSKIRKAGGVAYNINTNVRDGCNSYSNGGRLYQLVEDMRAQGFPVDVHIFKSCPHGYCAYRYPNGHQALYWFSQQFKRNFRSAGINQDVEKRRASTSSESKESISESSELDTVSQMAKYNLGPLPGLW